MARIKYSGLIDSINGAIGGTVFQNNKYGFTVKRKPNIIRPNKPRQIERQSGFSLLATNWRSMSSSQRTAYDSYASTYPQYAKNNPSAQLDGYSVYMRYNAFRWLGFQYILENPLGTQPGPANANYRVLINLQGLAADVDVDTGENDYFILIFMSQVLSPGQNFVGTKPKFVYADNFYAEQYDVNDAYEALYGYIPEDGDRVAMSVRLISKVTPYVLASVDAVYTVLDLT